MIPILDAKRESRRLVGDYMVNQNDVESGRMFPDRIAYSGWDLDIHHPKGIYSGKEGSLDFKHNVPLNSIPFRSIYSKNIENLLMAGRCLSYSHVALGTVRVQSTLATVGQAAGTAAAMCIDRNIDPRMLGQKHIAELQQELHRVDMRQHMDALHLLDRIEGTAVEGHVAGDLVPRRAPAQAEQQGAFPFERGPDVDDLQEACPERQVVCVAGDGGFMMVCAELATAVQEGIAVPIIVINNGQLGVIKRLQKQQCEGRYIAVDMLNPDFGILAAAFGMPHARVETADAFEPALRAALGRSVPTLIEVVKPGIE